MCVSYFAGRRSSCNQVSRHVQSWKKKGAQPYAILSPNCRREMRGGTLDTIRLEIVSI